MSRKTLIALLSTAFAVITLLAIIFGLYRNFRFTPNSMGAVGGRSMSESIEEDLDSFKSISIDTEVSDITIKSGDTFHISANYGEDNKRSITLSRKVMGDKLVITQSVKQKAFFLSGESNINCSLTVTVPEGTELSDVDIESDVGEIYVSDVLIDRLFIDSNVGETELVNVKGDDLTVSSDVGDIDIRDITFDIVSVNSEVGEIGIRNSIIESLEADSSVGDIELENVANSRGEQPFLEISSDIGKEKIR